MKEAKDLASACKRESVLAGQRRTIFSLNALATKLQVDIDRLPVSLRILLESVIRNCDGEKSCARDVRRLAAWKPTDRRTDEIPFVVGRIVIQDVAGIPLLCDLAAMRSALERKGHDPRDLLPQVPVDMVIDHTLSVDYHGSGEALQRNMGREFERNEERFRFVKWAKQAFSGINVIPPGYGILHQINLEHFARGVLTHEGVCYPDSLVGTDSHTCMIAGLGVLGWGVGGIEAEAAMLGQPISLLMPDVVGVELRGSLRAGVTATDLVLHLTETLRKEKVVGKFVEFCGEGAAHLTVPDRATLANMAVEYGATIGYFPYDAQTSRYLRETGRDEAEVGLADAYFRSQGLFGAADPKAIQYSQVLTFDLAQVEPCVAGPKRPQDRVPLSRVPESFSNLRAASQRDRGATKGTHQSLTLNEVQEGHILIAAITSCTNTSNPQVMLAAGLVARNAVQRGMKVRPWVKTSLTPGSRVVGRYLQATELQQHLDALGFSVAGYGCATCVGNSGPLDPALEQAVREKELIVSAVLSGNRNFEARIHPAVQAAYLMSPPLVVAYALAGSVLVDLQEDPLGHDSQGNPVFLHELWPSWDELDSLLCSVSRPDTYIAEYRKARAGKNKQWEAIPTPTGPVYEWDSQSTYIKEPPYFYEPALSCSSLQPFSGARALAILGDSVTTDHISPISNIEPSSPAGQFLEAHGVSPKDFNTYGSRRMNHEVMVRGTFANIRLRNRICPDIEGGVTVVQPSGQVASIYEAAMRYAEARVPLIIVAGEEYGTGSARDWAAKGTRLLGVRAVVAKSFERIHRSNLIGMGVLPCELPQEVSVEELNLDGTEEFSLAGLNDDVAPRSEVTLSIQRDGKAAQEIPVTLRLDTPAEVTYARRGGILPYMLDRLVSAP